MPLAWWVPAYDGYALALVVTKQLKLKTTLKHKYLVLQVAAEAPADVDGGLVAVVYDKLVRCACRFCFCFFFHHMCLVRQGWAEKSTSRTTFGEDELKGELKKVDSELRDRAVNRARQLGAAKPVLSARPVSPVRNLHVPSDTKGKGRAQQQPQKRASDVVQLQPPPQGKHARSARHEKAPAQGVMCFNCKQRGHLAKDCPNAQAGKACLLSVAARGATCLVNLAEVNYAMDHAVIKCGDGGAIALRALTAYPDGR